MVRGCLPNPRRETGRVGAFLGQKGGNGRAGLQSDLEGSDASPLDLRSSTRPVPHRVALGARGPRHKLGTIPDKYGSLHILFGDRRRYIDSRQSHPATKVRGIATNLLARQRW